MKYIYIEYYMLGKLFVYTRVEVIKLHTNPTSGYNAECIALGFWMYKDHI